MFILNWIWHWKCELGFIFCRKNFRLNDKQENKISVPEIKLEQMQVSAKINDCTIKQLTVVKIETNEQKSHVVTLLKQESKKKVK